MTAAPVEEDLQRPAAAAGGARPGRWPRRAAGVSVTRWAWRSALRERGCATPELQVAQAPPQVMPSSGPVEGAGADDAALEEAAAGAVADGSSSSGAPEQQEQREATTMVIYNLGKHLTRAKLCKKLDNMGFKGQYNFVHMPMDLQTSHCSGIAFVNFLCPEDGRRFQALKPGARPKNWRVNPAMKQGLEAHLEMSQKGQMTRIRNPKFRPLVLPNGERDEATGAPPKQPSAASQAAALALEPRAARAFAAGALSGTELDPRDMARGAPGDVAKLGRSTLLLGGQDGCPFFQDPGVLKGVVGADDLRGPAVAVPRATDLPGLERLFTKEVRTAEVAPMYVFLANSAAVTKDNRSHLVLRAQV